MLHDHAWRGRAREVVDVAQDDEVLIENDDARELRERQSTRSFEKVPT